MSIHHTCKGHLVRLCIALYSVKSIDKDDEFLSWGMYKSVGLLLTVNSRKPCQLTVERALLMTIIKPYHNKIDPVHSRPLRSHRDDHVNLRLSPKYIHV